MECRICGNKENLTAYRVREMMFGLRESFTYIMCGKCGCLQIEKIPEDMSVYYPPGYYSFNMPVQGNCVLKERLKRIRDRSVVSGRGRAGMYLAALFPDPLLEIYSGLPSQTRILDVGCGTGGFACRLKEAGLENITGIDPFLEKNIEYDNGLQIKKKSLGEVSGTWDLITWHHSFEHIADPYNELKRAVSLLAENGRCMLRIPLVDSYAWEHYGTNWVQIDAPRHFFIHSRRSIGIVADRAGLTIDSIRYDSTAFQFWGSEQYARDIPMNDKRSYEIDPARSIFSRKEIRNYRLRASELNERNKGDQVVIFLTRKGNE